LSARQIAGRRLDGTALPGPSVINVVAAGAPPLARLAELGVARISFAGSLMVQLYGAHETRLSEIAAEAAAIA
jgi:2-methylisocitrate lyase-like PEP mutase family enzyme